MRIEDVLARLAAAGVPGRRAAPLRGPEASDRVRGDHDLWPELYEPNRPLKAAAVLVPIIDRPQGAHILLTRRTDHLHDHAGQISFPGGVYQEGDGTLADTALRECAEEVGLASGEVEILGELDDVATLTSNYIISPFVAFIPWPYQFKVNEEEIDELVEIPISVLLDRNSRHEETRTINGKAVASYSYHYQGKVIWGATATILSQFLDIFAGVVENKSV